MLPVGAETTPYHGKATGFPARGIMGKSSIQGNENHLVLRTRWPPQCHPLVRCFVAISDTN